MLGFGLLQTPGVQVIGEGSSRDKSGRGGWGQGPLLGTI